MYRRLIEPMEADCLSESLAMAFPNNIKLTKIGPMVVPNELILPAKFKRCEPLEGSPMFNTKGLAEVCCNEKPKAIIKNAINIKAKEPELMAGIIVNAPMIERKRPYRIVRL